MVIYGNGKHRLVTALLSVAVLSAASAGAIAVARAPSPAEEENAAGGFILRELDGCVAVYEPGAPAEGPLIVTEIELRSLPEADREALRDGLTVPDREALLQLLEDLNS